MPRDQAFEAKFFLFSRESFDGDRFGQTVSTTIQSAQTRRLSWFGLVLDISVG